MDWGRWAASRAVFMPQGLVGRDLCDQSYSTTQSALYQCALSHPPKAPIRPKLGLLSSTLLLQHYLSFLTRPQPILLVPLCPTPLAPSMRHSCRPPTHPNSHPFSIPSPSILSPRQLPYSEWCQYPTEKLVKVLLTALLYTCDHTRRAEQTICV